MIGTFELGTAFVLGLTASFAPCLFPVLPSFVAFLTKSDTKRFSPLLAGVLTTLGIMTVFVTFGLLLNSSDAFLQFFGGSNYLSFRFWEGVILIVLGILIMGRITFGTGAMYRLSDKVQTIIQSVENPFLVSYLIGLFFAILAAPCAIIVFSTLINLMITNPGASNAVFLNVFFSLGAGVPFLVMGILVPELKTSFLDNSEKLFRIVPIVTGIIIILMGSYLMYDAYNLGYEVSFL